MLMYLGRLNNCLLSHLHLIRGRIVFFFFQYTVIKDPLNISFVNLSWPRAHNPYSPHISEPTSFHFSSENLVICQELSSKGFSYYLDYKIIFQLRLFLNFNHEIFILFFIVILLLLLLLLFYHHYYYYIYYYYIFIQIFAPYKL